MNQALKWKLIAGFILVFVAGGISGAFLGGLYARHLFFGFAEAHRQMAANLTDEQRQKLQQIEERHRRWHHGRFPHELPAESPSATP